MNGSSGTYQRLWESCHRRCISTFGKIYSRDRKLPTSSSPCHSCQNRARDNSSNITARFLLHMTRNSGSLRNEREMNFYPMFDSLFIFFRQDACSAHVFRIGCSPAGDAYVHSSTCMAPSIVLLRENHVVLISCPIFARATDGQPM